jgi:site-specific DNA recombinase
VVADRVLLPTRRLHDGGDRCPLGILSIEAKLRRAGKGKRLVIQNGVEPEVNEGLVALIKEAFAIRNQLLSGSDDSIESMSGRLTMNKGRLTSLVRLSYLAPDIVRAFLAGRQPIALTPTALLRLSKDLPDDWKELRVGDLTEGRVPLAGSY